MKIGRLKNTWVACTLLRFVGIISFIISFAGCQMVMANTGNKETASTVFTKKLTEPIVICIPFDAKDKTVGQWAIAENEIDWDGKDEQSKLLCTAAYAAVELKTYLQKICPQASITLADKSAMNEADIVIGQVDAMPDIAGKITEPTSSESYTITHIASKEKQTLMICGFDRAGMLYGTYELLDRLGVRWFGPQEWMEVVPNRDTLTLTDLPITASPSFTNHRGFHDETKMGTPEMFTWMARNKLNLWSYDEKLYPLQRKLCILISGGDHTWKLMLHPTKIRDEQGQTLFELHPEWFAMIDGKRTPEEYQPCVSNDEALDYMLKRFIELLQKSPYKCCDIINFWPYDSFKPWCQCLNCTKLGKGTDKYIYAVAKINKGLKEAYAQGLIQRVPRLGLCAYEGTASTEPPTMPVPADFDYQLNSFTFFPINRCYVHTLDDPTCTEMNTVYAQQFEAWYDSPYKGDLVAGEYYNVSVYQSLPLLFYKTAPYDMRYYYHNHARGFNYMHATCGEWGTRTLTNWMMAKLCWNIDTNSAALLGTFFDEFFGPAAKDMREVFDDISDGYANVAAWRSHADTSIFKRLLGSLDDQGMKTPFNLEHLQWDKRAKGNNSAISAVEGLKKLESATEKISTAISKNMSADIRKRIQEVQWHLKYGTLSYQLYTILSQTLILDRSGQTEQAKEEFKKAPKLVEELRKNSFTFEDINHKNNWLTKTNLEPVFNYYIKKYEDTLSVIKLD